MTSKNVIVLLNICTKFAPNQKLGHKKTPENRDGFGGCFFGNEVIIFWCFPQGVYIARYRVKTLILCGCVVFP